MCIEKETREEKKKTSFFVVALSATIIYNLNTWKKEKGKGMAYFTEIGVISCLALFSFSRRHTNSSSFYFVCCVCVGRSLTAAACWLVIIATDMWVSWA